MLSILTSTKHNRKDSGNMGRKHERFCPFGALAGQHLRLLSVIFDSHGVQPKDVGHDQGRSLGTRLMRPRGTLGGRRYQRSESFPEYETVFTPSSIEDVQLD